MSAVERWVDELRAWAIPEAILTAAPRDPYAFPGHVIRRAVVDPLQTPTGEAVTTRLAPGERLLDVGVGAGRIAAAFVPDHAVVGVEPRQGLAEEARARGIVVVDGPWPEVADQVPTAPVVLSTHVLYDVADPVPFIRGLHAAAERRVVLEVTAVHPWVPVGPLYRVVHGIDRPAGPSAELLASVVEEVVGTPPQVVRWDRVGRTYDTSADYLDHQRRMLCIDESDPRCAALDAAAMAVVEVDDGGGVHLPAVAQATLWWDVDGGA
jgi:SAM-dependent methyltransferase